MRKGQRQLVTQVRLSLVGLTTLSPILFPQKRKPAPRAVCSVVNMTGRVAAAQMKAMAAEVRAAHTIESRWLAGKCQKSSLTFLLFLLLQVEALRGENLKLKNSLAAAAGGASSHAALADTSLLFTMEKVPAANRPR